ncbi:LVIVD repeat-containing protein [Geotalea uraniireducens]|nr:alpha/beta hydrolase [Geotalea uraniireducens]
MGVIEPKKLNALRVAGVSDYSYADADGNPQSMDLALTGGGGRLKTVDLTDPYNPQPLATVKDALDKEVVSYPYDITLNKETGLAIVSTLSAIQVVDVKDPKNPRLINTITQLPNSSGATTPEGSPAMIPIGTIPAMAEKDGWLYMADQTKGMRTMGINTNDIRVYNESNIQVPEIGYSKGGEDDRRYYVEVKYEDPDINCNDDDLVGSMVIKTRKGAVVNPLPGIDHPTQYLLSFRKGSDEHCYADLKKTITSPTNKRFIATNFPAADLTLTTVDGMAIAPVFGSIGTKAIFEFSNRKDGRLMRRKNIPLEKLIRIAFDGNRDGKIRFDDPEDKKYTFWVNDDHDTGPDVRNAEVGLFDDDIYSSASDANDTEVDQINTLRDLEDFAQVHIQIDEHARNVIKFLTAPHDTPPPVFSYQLQFKNVNGTNPSLNLFEAVTDGTKYLSEYKTALLQLYNKRIVTIDSVNVSDLPANVLMGTGASHFIFEGKSSGTGDLTISLKSDGVDIEENSAKLDLKPITWFYDKYQVAYDDLAKRVLTSYTTRKGDYQPKNNDYIFYVHGWNMTNGEVEKERWAETMFKRLWWSGYTGKVGLFSWPTLEGALTFDESEIRAWNSSEAFKNLLLSGDMTKYQGKIRLLGHSMGGIVSGETINKLPGPGIVHTYIATQAALSAHYYDNTITEKSLAAKIPGTVITANIFGYYMSGNETSSDKPYLSSSTQKAKHINYFNRLDFALSRGDEGYAAWELNSLTRPDFPYSYVPLGSIHLNGLLPLYLPDDRYEVFSRIIQSRAKAIGAVSSAINNFYNDNNKDLKVLFDYDTKHYSHSRQFRSTIIQEKGYWKAIMSDFRLTSSY